MPHPFRRIGSLLSEKVVNAKSSRKFAAELKSRTQAVQQSKRTPTPSEIVNYLLKAGIDYKGQFNYAFQPVGIDSTFGFGMRWSRTTR